MKNTESGPPRSPGPLMHVDNAPASVPCKEKVVSLRTAYSHGKPQNHLSPHPQVPCDNSSSRIWESRQQASGYLSRGLEASVRDRCSWTNRGQQKPPRVV